MKLFQNKINISDGLYLLGSLDNKILKWPLLLTGLVFALGLLITARGFNVLYDYSQENLRTEIKRRYEAKAEQLQERIDLGLESLTSIAALYKASDLVSREAFQIFVHSDAAFHEGTIALGWVPRVTEESRKAFIEKARQESSPRFNIFEVSGHGMPGSSKTHNDYFPIYHLISLHDERLSEGMNLAAVPSKRRAMQAAVKLKTTTVTRRIHLYNGTGQFGFQAFLPVPETGKKYYEDISTVSGFAMGQFDISALLKSVFADENDLGITLLDSTARENEQLLYNFGSGSDQEIKLKKVSEIESLTTPHWVRRFNVGDRQWIAVFRSSNQASVTKGSWLPYLGVISGILITSLISLYLFLAQLRGRQLFLSRQREEEERALKTEAVEENLSKSRFLRAASHDLRQPLNTLSLYTDLLSNEVSPDSKSADLIDRIKISTKSMNNMFNALLDLGRLEAGELQSEISNFHVEDLLEKLGQEFSMIAEEKNLQFQLEKTTGIITSDPNLLERILRNLLSNAISYTESGKVLLSCEKKGEELRIQISDTGPGFDEEIKKNLFEEFYREDKGSQSNDQGLGLGLSIVSHTAKLLGHNFGAYSEKGKGATFYVDVPYEETL